MATAPSEHVKATTETEPKPFGISEPLENVVALIMDPCTNYYSKDGKNVLVQDFGISPTAIGTARQNIVDILQALPSSVPCIVSLVTFPSALSVRTLASTFRKKLTVQEQISTEPEILQVLQTKYKEMKKQLIVCKQCGIYDGNAELFTYLFQSNRLRKRNSILLIGGEAMSVVLPTVIQLAARGYKVLRL